MGKMGELFCKQQEVSEPSYDYYLSQNGRNFSELLMKIAVLDSYGEKQFNSHEKDIIKSVMEGYTNLCGFNFDGGKAFIEGCMKTFSEGLIQVGKNH